MQLVGRGAQDQLVTGNPSFTHFRSVYKRHSEFAMEHFRLYFKTTNLSLPAAGSLTLRTKLERYADLIHDCYLSVNIPDIYSPLWGSPASGFDDGYKFQWVRNLGYNMINHVSVVINGQEVVRHTGEWMKLYAALNFSGPKKAMTDLMVGNVPELYDPANAFGRTNQYPHSVANNSGLTPNPSIPGRVLTIPLHFWFCESVGMALPLISLQYSEVEIIVELKNMFQLFTYTDLAGGRQPTQNTTTSQISMSTFLSPPEFPFQLPMNPTLTMWNLDPFIEANYIFIGETERVHLAKTEQSFIITQVDLRSSKGNVGAGNDLELLTRNLCTRVVFVAHRNDRINDYDNYTNWTNPYSPPNNSQDTLLRSILTSGSSISPGVNAREILLEANIILDGKDRFGPKQTEFFSHIQHYRHHDGFSTSEIPGVYAYSFALTHGSGQPSGHINGSMFNKVLLRATYIQPPFINTATLAIGAPPATICVLKSTANSAHPVVISPVNQHLYSPSEVVTVTNKTSLQTFAYTFNVNAYVESYNYLRVIGGHANVMFSQ